MISTADSTPHELGVTDTVVVHTRKGRQIALPRLRGLFSTTSPSSVARPSTGRLEESLSTGVSPKQSKTAAKRLKIRVLSWNMHDSLPKGDLQELLGKVPSHNSSNSQPGILPNLPEGPDHPFHLIVIAGQECPTSSGIPMGLGAGFRLLDKDREKLDDSEKDADKARQHKFDRSKHSKSQEDMSPHEHPGGWTSMVEEWLCRGGGCSARNASPTVSDVGHPKPLIRRLSSKEHRRGPYQLLAKERLMGIYLAIYVHRDVKSLVRGTSKSAVTAGLIGGRLGNKGGVGISVNLDGTTLLFLNAHLAAHEGNLKHRLANLSKIKAELDVDDFLTNDDSRSMADDITDKFDYSFICGDLNFRLDISRLHADWLISREEFTQALAFDQLRKVMEEGTEFLGFHEGPINFPPTFKYDVAPHSKYSKGHASKPMRLERAGDKSTTLTDFEERELENGEANETASMVSSTSTSVKSKVWDRESDGECVLSPSTPTMATSGSKASFASAGTRKAKLKWLALLSPSLSSPTALFRPKHQHASSPLSGVGDFPLPRNYHNYNLQGKNGHDTRPPMILVDASKPNPNNDGTPILEERGVYDSSNKRRVPSWCDRILWKSTVVPDPLPEENVPGLSGRKRLSNFFANAFRTSSGRIVVETPKDPPRDGEFKQEQSIFTKPSLPPQPKTALEKGARHPQRGNSAFVPPSTAPIPIDHPRGRPTSHLSPKDALPRGPSSGDSSRRPSPLTAPSRWRFIPFLSPPPELDTATGYGSPHLPSPPKPRKGDVVCLSYDTLDDRAIDRKSVV